MDFALDPDIEAYRQELRRFAKVAIEPGATETVSFELDDRCFSVWSEGWVMGGGPFDVRVGLSSRAFRAPAPTPPCPSLPRAAHPAHPPTT